MNIRLTNHIAYRFLNDESIIWEILELHHHEMKDKQAIADQLDNESFIESEAWRSIKYTWNVLSPQGNRSYYITDSVKDNLELLKVKRNAEGRYDYTIFAHLKPQKATFIFPENKLIRMYIPDGAPPITFEYIRFEKDPNIKHAGRMNSCLFYVDRETGEQCTHFAHPDVKEIEDYLYKLLCFVYLSEVEEILLQPGQKMGTKKSGKLINEIKQPLVVVTSKWNITSIRTEGFKVSGHFRLQPHGEGRKQVRVQWIDPFDKEGYVRRAQKDIT